MKIKTGDTVRVTTGADKGKTGKVVQVFKNAGLAVVEGINSSVKHLKPKAGQSGQKVTFNAPIQVSKLQIAGKKISGRAGYKLIDKAGKMTKIRVVRKDKKSEDVE
jgi:large subunit ribosomal protein L24